MTLWTTVTEISMESNAKSTFNFTTAPTVSSQLKIVAPQLLLPRDKKYMILFELSDSIDTMDSARNESTISAFDIQGASYPTVNNSNEICLTVYFASGSTDNAFVKFVERERGIEYNNTLLQNFTMRMAYGCVTVSSNGGTYDGKLFDEQDGIISSEPAILLPFPVTVPAKIVSFSVTVQATAASETG